jgi:UDP-N-acetyl-2-amino-2-deoxyglucuronate dehydrogenase
MYRFALTGAAGFVAPRHMKAIRETGHELTCALDPYDGIGILDNYFPRALFFTQPELFESYIESKKGSVGEKIDFVSICSPNDLHEAHIRMALRHGADAICEKPLVLNPETLDVLQEMEKETGKKVFTILQLRHHPSVVKLKALVENRAAEKVYEVDLNYITSRGNWYFSSWKGNVLRSGGIVTNLGIHFIDMLGWIFGDFKGLELHVSRENKAAGKLWFTRANVKWFLSIDENDLPAEAVDAGKRTYRKVVVDGEETEFSEGFTDLHTTIYREILAGRGFGISDARKSIEIVSAIRKTGG